MFNKNEGKNCVMKKADKMNNSIIWLICILFLLRFSGCGSKNVDVTFRNGHGYDADDEYSGGEYDYRR